MKKILLSSLILAISSSYVYANNKQGYELTTTPDGNSYIFSKTESPYSSYILKSTNGKEDMEYHFISNPNKPSFTVDTAAISHEIMWKDTNTNSQHTGFNQIDLGKRTCSELQESHRHWRLPTLDDIQIAIDNKDMGAVAALKPTERNYVLNMYLVDNEDKTAAALITGFPDATKVSIQPGALGTLTPRIICISD
ncbi:hypothetical protein [Photobacterium damselae]|uniref:hypothetical protein n=1 Tax=Photobacterium damselae TaxID=38293 RepID=UPI001EFDCC49|nr:hypothetical protein [Photobacterium damselae]MCG9778839.1 hypothetical protein [Photobacterium damselae]